MAETETERPEIHVTLAGEKLRLILPGDGWKFKEAKAAKEISDFAPVEIEERLLVADPDAWLAVLRVSYMRAGKEFPAEALEDEDVIELGRVVTKTVLEAIAKRPPTSQSGNGSSEPAKDSESEPSEVQS